jgi:Fe-S cluster biogenesis protein NfuA
VSDEPEDEDLRERLRRVEGLIEDVEAHFEPEAQAKTREIVDAVLELHAAGLARLLAIAKARDDGLPDALAGDELVASLLVLHGLHPLDLEARVTRALERVRTGLMLQGSEATLVALDPEGAVRVRLVRTGQGCGSGTGKARSLLEDALARAAPEASVAIELGGDPGPAPPGRPLPLYRDTPGSGARLA